MIAKAAMNVDKANLIVDKSFNFLSAMIIGTLIVVSWSVLYLYLLIPV